MLKRLYRGWFCWEYVDVRVYSRIIQGRDNMRWFEEKYVCKKGDFPTFQQNAKRRPDTSMQPYVTQSIYNK